MTKHEAMMALETHLLGASLPNPALALSEVAPFFLSPFHRIKPAHCRRAGVIDPVRWGAPAGHIPPNLQSWIDARRKLHLSHEHVQMARELGMNPKKLGKLDNHDQEPWKLPLQEFIGKLYFKRFGKKRPDAVRRIEETAAAKQTKKQAKKAARDGAPRMVDQRDDPTL